MKRKRHPTQNKHVRARTTARRQGKRQTPHLKEHLFMMYPGQGRYDPDNDGDNDAGDTDAAGETSTP